MIDIVIYEDNLVMNEQMDITIKKYLQRRNIVGRVYRFVHFNNNLEEIINNHRTKIYILDLDVDGTNGIELATMIRNSGDWTSIIIITSGHCELLGRAIKSRIQIFDYIEKTFNYFSHMSGTLDTAYKALHLNINTSLNHDDKYQSVSEHNINFIEKLPNSNKCVIHLTNFKLIEIEKSLQSFSLKFSSDFTYSHRCCLINLKNIAEINYSTNTIKFVNGEETNLLSRNYKRDLKHLLRRLEKEDLIC